MSYRVHRWDAELRIGYWVQSWVAEFRNGLLGSEWACRAKRWVTRFRDGFSTRHE